MLGDYLRLARIPNIFTVPSNILAGYFTLVMPIQASIVQLFLLASSSILLYTSGVVFNDYFDIEIDLKERPYRPLPSGSITKRNAAIIAVVSMIGGNLIAFQVDVNSCLVSALISAVVIAYDYVLKKTKFGPIAMSLARSLNIILGASPAAYLLIQNHNLLIKVVFICLSVFGYVFSISLLSRKEVSPKSDKKEERKRITIEANQKTVASSFLIIFSIVVSIALFVFLGIFRIDLFINLALFCGIMISILFKQVELQYSYSSIQEGIKYMVIGIIVFDSVFITGAAGLYYGLSVLMLIIPAIILSRRLYVT